MQMTKNLITGGAIICGMAASSGCNSITANYHDPSQEATLYAGTQRILAPREGQMETVGSLPNAIDLPLTFVVDTIVIPINLVYIFTCYEPNVKEAPQPEPESADLLRKRGAKTGKELKAEGK